MIITVAAVILLLGYAIIKLSTKSAKTIKADVSKFLVDVQILLHTFRTGSIVIPEKYDQKLRAVEDIEKNDGSSYLLTRAQVESTYPTSSWERIAYEEFKETITNSAPNAKTFPCVYATAGYKSNDHRYVFLASDDPSSPSSVRILGQAIEAYLKIAPTIGSNTSLVIICANSSKSQSLEEYTTRFWNFLRGLRIVDRAAWPREIPSATGDSNWMMCYAGEAFFPIALTPAHKDRRSRHAENFVIAMQPKWVLDRLLSTPAKRDGATTKVRNLLREYDDIDISPDLTTYGAEGTTESRQLVLRDDNVSNDCPYADMDQ